MGSITPGMMTSDLKNPHPTGSDDWYAWEHAVLRPFVDDFLRQRDEQPLVEAELRRDDLRFD